MASASSTHPSQAGAKGARVCVFRRSERSALALALVLAAALGLRLWGVRSGLPYVYNVDEAAHFVPRAVAMSAGSLDPRYFVNPPALTYALHVLFTVWWGGAKEVLSAYAEHRASVFLLARLTVALSGVLAVWLLYLLGVRLLEDRRIALLAAALEAVAFLPVFYGHFALNDAFTLAPLTLSLLGSALVLRCGRARDYALAGGALGLACASKYTAGIALLPLLAAAGVRYRDGAGRRGERRPGSDRSARDRHAAGCVALAGACALVAFVLANPYALLDFHRFRADLAHQSALSGQAQGKLGAPSQGGLLYYLWSLTWGLGWVPALAALGGALAIWRRDARAGWLLVPPLLAFGAFMGLQSRYYGRWLLPIFPFLCLLAAYLALDVARRTAVHAERALRALSSRRPMGQAARPMTRSPRLAPLLTSLAAVALLAQGVLYSIHADVVLSRADTRASVRAWMLAHVPRAAHIVLEPIVRDEWLREGGPGPPATGPPRWQKYPDLGPLVSASGASTPNAARAKEIEEYELTLTPTLIARYEQGGYCWVISGSIQSGRAFSSPRRARWAIAYYRALARDGRIAYHVSPYAPGSAPVAFSFDWSFDYYPLSYARPGPEVLVYRLHGGRCAR